MSDESDSVLEKYSRQTGRRQRRSPPAEAPEYRAFRLDPAKNPQSRLRVHYLDGTVSVLAYSYLMEVLWSTHKVTQYVTLFYTHCVLQLEGRNLMELVTAIQDEKVRSLHCFHPKHDRTLAGNDPVISQIERKGVQQVANDR